MSKNNFSSFGQGQRGYCIVSDKMAAVVAGPSKVNGVKMTRPTKKKSKDRVHQKQKGEEIALDDGETSDASFSSSGSHRKLSITSTSDLDEDRATQNGLRSWKGKGIAVSAFQDVQPTIDIPIPPALCHAPIRAAEELMDSLLMRYVPELGGVLISHQDIRFQRNLATIDGDGAFSVAPASMTLRIWAPKIAMRLEGRIILSTPSHISVLVHEKFNASIVSSHLPSVLEMARLKKEKGYRWHEFTEEEMNGVDVEMGEDHDHDHANEQNGNAGEKSTGYWLDAATGDRLGGEDGKVTFTVVGLTIANHMLSVHGSLLRKPFSVPAPTYAPALPSSSKQKVDNVVFAEASRRVRFQESDDENEEDDGDSAINERDTDEADHIATNVYSDTVVHADSSKEKKKKRHAHKVGPRREWDTSGSESEGDAKREKKKRKKG